MDEREQRDVTEETSIVPVEKLELEEMQLVEQLYNSAGLDPVVEAGLRDYDERIQSENRLLSKVLGPRASDIRGYGESVARRVAYAVYALMNRQYGGKVGDLRSHIMALQDERDRANTRYDDLMGRVVGILGEEYKDLRSDSKVFMEKLTTVLGEEYKEARSDSKIFMENLTKVLGEDLKGSKIDQQALAEKLADIDGLRNQIIKLTAENEQLKQQHQSQQEKQKKDSESAIEEQKKNYETSIEKQKESYEAKLEKQQTKFETNTEKLTDKHEKAVKELQDRIAGLDTRVKELESENSKLTAELGGLKNDYARLKIAADDLNQVVSLDEMRTTLGEELHTFILDDSKVPDMVIDGVGKFIDFRKYLGIAAVKGAEMALKAADASLKGAMKK